jgi:hypothetical protein
MRSDDGKDGGAGMTGSEAHKKLKKEVEVVEKPEWVFKVFHKPAGLFVDHFGDTMSLSKAELEDLVEGKVNMKYYTMVPKVMYRAFMIKVCEALGVVYRPYMVKRVTPEVMPKARIVFPEKTVFEEMEKWVETQKVSYRILSEEIKALEEFFKMVKKK